ncbi:hypothetical protein B0H14DRAFT_2327044, partial [Mycena olivaceomarginata]
FVPDHVVANVGDIIRFTFMNGNHSSFETPCQKLPNGYASNFLPVSGITAPRPQWDLTVNTTTPLWFFCAQSMYGHTFSRPSRVLRCPTDHCADNVMVFA